MHIRLATIADALAISELIQPLAQKFITREFSPEGAANLLNGMTKVAIESFLRAGFRYHVAEEDGVMAGVVGVRDDNRHLYHLFVAEPFQRQGLARQLWEVAKEACLATGNPGEFTVNSSKFAVQMYQRLGFVETGPPWERDGVVAIPMRLSLPTKPDSEALNEFRDLLDQHPLGAYDDK